jgi:hypothetical protein
MDGVFRRAVLKPVERENDILVAIRDVCMKMENVNVRFEMEKDSDLIEACIYEMESLRARYRYLLRVAKQQGLKAGGHPLIAEKVEKVK